MTGLRLIEFAPLWAVATAVLFLVVGAVIVFLDRRLEDTDNGRS